MTTSPTGYASETTCGIGDVYFSNRLDAAPLCSTLDEAGLFYEAKKMFVEELYAPDRLLSFKLEEGDMLIVDNTRVLHGRSAFELSADAEISADATETAAGPPLPAAPSFNTHGDDTGAGGTPDLSKFSRYLRGCYMDGIDSKFRVHMRQLAKRNLSQH